MIGEVDEKVKKVLEAIEVEDLEKLSRSECTRALARLLALKVKKEQRPSAYEVTKDVRKALNLVLKSPLKKNIDDAIASAVYMDTPFDAIRLAKEEDKVALNKAYRLLLKCLLRRTHEETAGSTPMWRRKLLNLMMENIYNMTMEGRDYADRILKALGGETSEQLTK